ncbi:MAG: nicotinate-nucleotide adenylyltransferase [Bacteroidales bacterium]|jgi:nicotinate-nucleotide adenylyltransferase|nr:nicotinate-nucleotide adenylyltransferase [Bacteroidales bacterium]
MSRIGLYFGSFNPVHSGHIAIAEYMLEHAPIDELWFVLSPQNPLKNPEDLWSNKIRYNLLRTAIGEHPKMSICTVEWNMPVPSYTIDTLQNLLDIYPANRFSVIMGSDNLQGIERWKSFEAILNNYSILVYPRPNTAPNAYFKHPNVTVFSDAPMMDISSTQIRNGGQINNAKEI